MGNDYVGFPLLVRLFLGLLMLADLGSKLMCEIHRIAQQGAKVVDGSPRSFEVLPCDLDDVREAFAVITCFTHKFKNQKI
ncbi:hypothetical protein AX768_30180 (plasmid) [Burkholderia sp. PAMC 28687]|nr:hypothetical protein AX768_30180 [Burkholderia sp. PAMC 28687]